MLWPKNFRLRLPGMTSLRKPVRKAVDLGIEAAEQGAFATEEEVHNAFARCGVKS